MKAPRQFSLVSPFTGNMDLGDRRERSTGIRNSRYRDITLQRRGLLVGQGRRGAVVPASSRLGPGNVSALRG